MSSVRVSGVIVALASVSFSQPAPIRMKSINPAVARVVESISEERIAAIMKRLEGFGTRNTFSETGHPTHGIGASRSWIGEQFRGYSPRLEVRFDRNAIKKGGRIWRDVRW